MKTESKENQPYGINLASRGFIIDYRELERAEPEGQRAIALFVLLKSKVHAKVKSKVPTQIASALLKSLQRVSRHAIPKYHTPHTPC